MIIRHKYPKTNKKANKKKTNKKQLKKFTKLIKKVRIPMKSLNNKKNIKNM